MKRETRKNRFLIGTFAILYIAYAVCLFWYHPFIASAKEPVPGGVNNDVFISYTQLYDSSKTKVIGNLNYNLKDGYEMVGYLSEYPAGNSSYQTLNIRTVKDGKFYNPKPENLSDYSGFETGYKSDNIESSKAFSMSDFAIKNTFYYSTTESDRTYTCEYSGMKIFADFDSMKAYAESGSLDGLVNDGVDVDSGIYDKDIGYLHDLKHKPLMYGEKDENGLYSSYDDNFTWSDYYPEYDDSYMVEVRASCEVEVKKWFGIGKSTIYNSDIRELAHDVKYKDLQFAISLANEKSVFADFLNEYMPGNSSISDVISAATYQFDTYYFRIYRWDDEAQTYKYGLWVRLNKDGTALDGSLNHKIDAGSIDKDGKWKTDPSSDYGDGKKGSATVGAGDSRDDAKDEADQKQEDKDSGIKDIDLSDTNFKELWEWFTGCLVSFWEGLGVIPDFFGRIFSFLPTPVIGFIALAIVAAIILRVIGR